MSALWERAFRKHSSRFPLVGVVGVGSPLTFTCCLDRVSADHAPLHKVDDDFFYGLRFYSVDHPVSRGDTAPA